MGKLVPNEIKLIHLLQRRYGTLKSKEDFSSPAPSRRSQGTSPIFFIRNGSSCHFSAFQASILRNSPTILLTSGAQRGSFCESIRFVTCQQLIINAVFLSVQSRFKTHLPNTKWHFYLGVGSLFRDHRCSRTSIPV